MQLQRISVQGRVTLRIERPNQKVEEFTIPNLVTDYGKEFIARRTFRPVDETVTPNFGRIKIGSGDTQALPDQNDLQGSEIIEKNIDSKELVNNELNFITTYFDTPEDTLGPEGSPVPVNEIGLFTDNGNMICRTVLSVPFTKTEGDLLSVFWKIEIG